MARSQGLAPGRENRTPPASEGVTLRPSRLRDVVCLGSPASGELPKAERSSREVTLRPCRLRAALSRRPLKGTKDVVRRKEIPGLPPGDRHRSWQMLCVSCPRARSRSANRIPPVPKGAALWPRRLRDVVCLGSPASGELPKAERSSREAALQPRRLRDALSRRPLKGTKGAARGEETPGLPPGDRHRSWQMFCGSCPRARSRSANRIPPAPVKQHCGRVACAYEAIDKILTISYV